jgi:hypothetical protein
MFNLSPSPWRGEGRGEGGDYPSTSPLTLPSPARGEGLFISLAQRMVTSWFFVVLGELGDLVVQMIFVFDFLKELNSWNSREAVSW